MLISLYILCHHMLSLTSLHCVFIGWHMAGYYGTWGTSDCKCICLYVYNYGPFLQTLLILIDMN